MGFAESCCLHVWLCSPDPIRAQCCRLRFPYASSPRHLHPAFTRSPPPDSPPILPAADSRLTSRSSAPLINRPPTVSAARCLAICGTPPQQSPSQLTPTQPRRAPPDATQPLAPATHCSLEPLLQDDTACLNLSVSNANLLRSRGPAAGRSTLDARTSSQQEAMRWLLQYVFLCWWAGAQRKSEGRPIGIPAPALPGPV